MLQVAEEVADLDIHCHYGCSKGDKGFIINPEGTQTFPSVYYKEYD